MLLKTYTCHGCDQKWQIDVDGPYVQQDFENIAYHIDREHGQTIRQQISNYVRKIVEAQCR